MKPRNIKNIKPQAASQYKYKYKYKYKLQDFNAKQIANSTEFQYLSDNMHLSLLSTIAVLISLFFIVARGNILTGHPHYNYLTSEASPQSISHSTLHPTPQPTPQAPRFMPTPKVKAKHIAMQSNILPEQTTVRLSILDHNCYEVGLQEQVEKGERIDLTSQLYYVSTIEIYENTM
ncbi:hypothetical protein B7494_g3336 [Chlorociboria aeruginascens]|nr:hypothetical protein B7494_g3336 [Chlorociboria aeruginascens]